jgi:3-polyprenyl-4-hydroxybenzoate decarboxylase
MSNATSTKKGASGSRASTSSSKPSSRSAPFDTLREYIEALEERGLVLRFEKLDQDAYEMTALMYRLIDQYGWEEAPVILTEQIKINGEWIKGPLIANHHGHLDIEAITFGVEPVIKNPTASYRKAMEHLQSRLVQGSFAGFL